MGESATMSPSD